MGVVGWLSGLSSLVLPVACAGCGRSDVALCGRCRDRLLQPPAHEVHPAAWSAQGRVPVFSAAAYEGAVRELLVAWKDGGRLDLTGPLADALARVVVACLRAVSGDPEQRSGEGPRRLLLVPVPSSKVAVRRRGEDVLYELARRAAGSLGPSGWTVSHVGESLEGAPGAVVGRRPTPRPVVGEVRAARLLTQRRGVRDQAGLGTAERLANTAGRLRTRRSWDDWWFRSGGPPAGSIARSAPVVLVDDIVTTGASLAAAAAALTASGATVLGAATVAWTPLRRVGTSVPHSPALRTVGYRRAGLAWTARPDERGEAPRA